MAVGSATPQRLGTIDPSSLIGQADTSIVEPRAVAALTDAFRQGVISSDDIVSRIGQLGTSKKKAEIMQAQEAVSPEAQALRAQQVAAGTEQAALAEAQAEKAQVYQKFPGVKDFDELRSLAGITEDPKTPEGKPDYAQMAVIGSKLRLQKAEKDKAVLDRNNIEAHYDNDARIVSSFTKQGLPVSPEYVQNLDRIIASPFSAQAPGTAQTIVSPRAATAGAPGIGMNGMPVPTAAAAPMVAPRAAAAPAPAPVIDAGGVPAAGTRVGMGTSLGPLPAPPGKPVDSVAQAQQLAAAQAVLPVIDTAIAAVDRGVGVGPFEGSGPVRLANQIGAAFGVREQELKDQRALEIAISNKILEGAQVMKGNLSDKDVRFLQATVPKLSDPEPVWRDYLNRWKQMAELNVEIVSGRVGKPAGDIFSVGWNETGTTTSAAPAATNVPPQVSTPAQAPSNAQYIQAPNGKYYRNPNFRP